MRFPRGTDRAGLEAACISYAASIGRLHALTIGKEAEFMAIRCALGDTAQVREKQSASWRTENVASFQALCAAVGVVPPVGLEAEIETISTAIDEPGPFLAFSPGDTCPDNHRLTDTPYARFFDFEGAGYFHSLLTAAYFYLPFPTCWCVNRLPGEIVAQMEKGDRRELVVGCPAAAEDHLFYPALLACCAYWTVSTLSWGWDRWLKEDNDWGISTVRQRQLLRLENFFVLAEQHNGYPALSTTARRLLPALRERFALEEEMPLYPAFRDPEPSSTE